MLAYAALRLPVLVWERPWTRSVAAGVGLTALAIAVPRQATLLKTVSDRNLEAPVDDLRRFADAHPTSRMAVGYSGTSRLSDARTIVVFRTQEYGSTRRPFKSTGCPDCPCPSPRRAPSTSAASNTG